jgi:antitoxin (DNA-binding transcriptional repressor) of toxin-antitoxin stability system
MIGIRDLRADLATHVRRAAAGTATTITVDGKAVAVLGPLSPAGNDQHATIAALVASGALIAPRRLDGRVADGTVPTWGGVRLDRLLREVRG